ncbi:MAG TPA: glycosyltransferase family 4 protein [Candidatus Acidoferrales bacterium]|nr:glycosyltransferase family 4 protein [Candidatus Acidoferrales bacterium]
MRIAQIAPLYESVPPALYGGTERVVSWLTEELVRLGHDVTLFASGDSLTTARLVPACKRALRLDSNCVDQLAHHIVMLDQVFSQKEAFDLLHFHVDYLHFPLSCREQVPQVTTLHGRLDLPDLAPLYRHFRDMPVVSISDAQRKPLPWANWQGTVHHGLPRESFSFGAGDGQYLAFLGRTSPEKGLDQAIEIAKRAGMLLKIAAKIDRVDVPYFEEVIKPLLDHPLIEFIGEIGYPEKNRFLGNAAALLFPINWCEPFGLVMIEAMACGTPVIAYPGGSVPEVMQDRITGFIVANLESAVKAVKRIGEIDRRKCRKHFERHFGAERMAQDYLNIYQRLTRRKSSSTAVSDGVLSWMKLETPSNTT